MPIPFLIPAIAAGVSALANLGGSALANRQLKKSDQAFKQGMANRPTIELPKELTEVQETLNRLAAGNRPGYETALSEIGQQTAQSAEQAKQGAISSNAYMNAIMGLNQQALEARQKESIRNEEYQLGMTDRALSNKNLIGEQKMQLQNINEYVPWQIGMEHEAALQQGKMDITSNFLSGLGNIASNLAGTSMLSSILNTGQGGGGNFVKQTMAKPFKAPVFSPQKDLLGTLNKYKGTLNSLDNPLWAMNEWMRK